MIKLLIFLTLFFHIGEATNTLTLPVKGSIHLTDFPMQYYIDDKAHSSIENIQKKAFTDTRSLSALGYQKKRDVWFRFTINNPGAQKKTVYIYNKEGYTFINVVFYLLKNNKLMDTQELGRHIPVHDRLVHDASPTYKLTLKPNETFTIYIKNNSLSSILSNIQVLDHDTYKHIHMKKNMLYSLLFGILISLAIYNAILYLSIKRSEYFYYVIFTLGSIAYQLYLSGIPLEFFDFKPVPYANLLFGVSILQLALFLFTQKVLETKILLPKLHLLINLFMGLPVIIFVLGLMLGIDTVLSIQAAVAMFSAFFLVFVGLIALRKKIAIARYYLLSIGIYLIFAIIGLATYFSLLPHNDFTRNCLHIASLSEAFLLSLMLSYRINLLQQRAALSEQQLHDEIKSRNTILSEQVTERTKELNTLNENLESKISLAVSEIRKKDENLLRQSRMAMMGEMLSMIAHQWKQPLAALMSVKSTMEIQVRLGEMQENQILSQLQDIEDYLQFMSKTVDDFSGFFKPDKKKEYFPLDALVDTSLLMMKTSFMDYHIRVETDYQLSKELFSFKNELLQVFLNLLKNSQDIFKDKAIPDAHIKISIKEFDDRQELTFEDNAGGISPQIIDKVFDPYFSTKEEKNGTGLGLYMSQTIIKEHCQGQITATNINHGASFCITLYLEDKK